MDKSLTQEKKPIFFPNLDALRFFCFLSVFFFHSFATKYEYISSNSTYHFIKKTVFGNGNLGVNFFFVLSGFLITYLLLVEKSEKNKIHVGKFYLRRILRIWPLFYFCVIFGFVAFPFLKKAFGEIPNETANPIWYLFFVNNIDFINKGLPDCSVLGVLWSVAIEEQFYLFWPLIIALVKPKHLPVVFFLILLASFGFRYINAHQPVILENHSFSCISDLTIGGMGAYLSFFSKPFLNFCKKIPKLFTAAMYVGTAVIFFFRQQLFNYNPMLLSIDRIIVSLFFLFIILEQNFNENSFFKLQSLKRISRLGQYTYGLYCLHMIGILIAAKTLGKLHFNTKLWQVLLVEGLSSLGISILIAYLSYHYFENKFLLIKKRFAVVRSGSISINHEDSNSEMRTKFKMKRKLFSKV